MPAEFMDAIGRAMLILAWQENLIDKDMPPRWMWEIDEELNRHFRKVKADRGNDTDDDDDDGSAHSGMLVNEYAQERRRNAR